MERAAAGHPARLPHSRRAVTACRRTQSIFCCVVFRAAAGGAAAPVAGEGGGRVGISRSRASREMQKVVFGACCRPRSSGKGPGSRFGHLG